jgi:hypothetical protein
MWGSLVIAHGLQCLGRHLQLIKIDVDPGSKRTFCSVCDLTENIVSTTAMLVGVRCFLFGNSIGDDLITSPVLRLSLGAFPGTIAGSGLMSFTFKVLPHDIVPSTGMYRRLLSIEKAKGSLRPLAKAVKGWTYAMSLPLLLEEEMAFLSLLADLLLCSTFSAAYLCAGGG